MEDDLQLTFRIAPWRPWLFAIAPLALLAAAGAVVGAINGQAAIAIVALSAFAAIALLLLLPIGLAVRASRWHVGANGIGGRDNMLAYHWLNWPEIESVTPWRIPGYRYLQVNGLGQPRAFWVPLFLTDMHGFRAAVARYAPPGNPLRAYLEQHPA